MQQASLEGSATEDELKAFLDKTATLWAWAGGEFDAPTDAQTVPADPPFAFAWHADDTVPTDSAVKTFLLDFSTPSQGSVLRVYTTETVYTPSASAWEKLVVTGEPVTLALTTATFDAGTLGEDSGPFIGQRLSFTVQ